MEGEAPHGSTNGLPLPLCTDRFQPHPESLSVPVYAPSLHRPATTMRRQPGHNSTPSSVIMPWSCSHSPPDPFVSRRSSCSTAMAPSTQPSSSTRSRGGIHSVPNSPSARDVPLCPPSLSAANSSAGATTAAWAAQCHSIVRASSSRSSAPPAPCREEQSSLSLSRARIPSRDCARSNVLYHR